MHWVLNAVDLDLSHRLTVEWELVERVVVVSSGGVNEEDFAVGVCKGTVGPAAVVVAEWGRCGMVPVQPAGLVSSVDVGEAEQRVTVNRLELTRFRGHLILDVSRGEGGRRTA